MRFPFLRPSLCCLLVFELVKAVGALPCEDSRCRTASCDEGGACLCELPDPSTVLDGDRLFLGGKYCDEEVTMCDSTNSFRCEHGSKCEEIVQGEVYACKCPTGYAGEHCELTGTPCGSFLCFHGAECRVEEGYVCDCPPDWRGSLDCLVPTEPSSQGYSTNSTTTHSHQSDNNGTNGVLVFFLVLCSLGAVFLAAVYVKTKLVDKKQRRAPPEQQSSQRQIYRMLDGDEDDEDDKSTEMDVIRDDKSHL